MGSLPHTWSLIPERLRHRLGHAPWPWVTLAMVAGTFCVLHAFRSPTGLPLTFSRVGVCALIPSTTDTDFKWNLKCITNVNRFMICAIHHTYVLYMCVCIHSFGWRRQLVEGPHSLKRNINIMTNKRKTVTVLNQTKKAGLQATSVSATSKPAF